MAKRKERRNLFYVSSIHDKNDTRFLAAQTGPRKDRSVLLSFRPSLSRPSQDRRAEESILTLIRIRGVPRKISRLAKSYSPPEADALLAQKRQFHLLSSRPMMAKRKERRNLFYVSSIHDKTNTRFLDSLCSLEKTISDIIHPP